MSDYPPPTVPPATPPPPGGGSYVPPPPPPPAGGGPAAGASGDRTLMIILAYLWILALIPLLTKKEDSDIQWHAKNGLAFTIAEIIFWVIFQVLVWVMPSGFGLGCGLSTLGCVLWFIFIAVHVFAIVKGINNDRFRLPVISDFADKM